jgi:hypothetical protein
MSTVPISLRQQFKWAWLEYQLDRPIGCIYAIPDFTPDGCGPNSLHSAIVRSLLNDPFGLADCEAAGDYHDFLYWVGGQEADRLAADKVLRRLLAATCRLPCLWPALFLLQAHQPMTIAPDIDTQLATLALQVQSLATTMTHFQAILTGTDDKPGLIILVDRLLQRDAARARLTNALTYLALGIILTAAFGFCLQIWRHIYAGQ